MHMPRQHQHRKQHKATGFTLIEVIIAMSIFAIVSLLAYSGLNTVMLSKSRTEVSLERLQELQLAMQNSPPKTVISSSLLPAAAGATRPSSHVAHCNASLIA